MGATFVSLLKDLRAARLYGRRGRRSKCVEDIDTVPVTEGSEGPRTPVTTAPGGLKRLHNEHWVTFAARAGYNMSHRAGQRRLWHGHCKDNSTEAEGEISQGIQKKESLGSDGGKHGSNTKATE